MATNKIKFGLKNVHYAVITETVTSGVISISYGTVYAWPGAVSMSLDAEGDSSTFYADNIPYFQQFANNGYSGTFESAVIPEDFAKNVLGEVESGHYLLEDADAVTKNFAMGFQIEGDQTETLFWYYYCTASRPSTEATTKEESIEPKTDSISFTAAPRPDNGYTRIRSTSATTDGEKAAWFTAVVEPFAATT